MDIAITHLGANTNSIHRRMNMIFSVSLSPSIFLSLPSCSAHPLSHPPPLPDRREQQIAGPGLDTVVSTRDIDSKGDGEVAYVRRLSFARDDSRRAREHVRLLVQSCHSPRARRSLKMVRRSCNADYYAHLTRAGSDLEECVEAPLFRLPPFGGSRLNRRMYGVCMYLLVG